MCKHCRSKPITIIYFAYRNTPTDNKISPQNKPNPSACGAQCATECRMQCIQFDSTLCAMFTIFTRWRYHYKLHGINIHLPIYSMSCGSNTIHVLLLFSFIARWLRKTVEIEKLSLFAKYTFSHCEPGGFEPRWALSHLIYPIFNVCDNRPFAKTHAQSLSFVVEATITHTLTRNKNQLVQDTIRYIDIHMLHAGIGSLLSESQVS